MRRGYLILNLSAVEPWLIEQIRREPAVDAPPVDFLFFLDESEQADIAMRALPIFENPEGAVILMAQMLGRPGAMAWRSHQDERAYRQLKDLLERNGYMILPIRFEDASRSCDSSWSEAKVEAFLMEASETESLHVVS